MKARTFVKAWRREMEQNLADVRDPQRLTGVQIAAMGLTPVQDEQLSALLRTLLHDTYYSLLLGLDGSASVGGRQEIYKILDEKGRVLGNLAPDAWDLFHDETQEEAVAAWHREHAGDLDELLLEITEEEQGRPG